MRVHPWLIVKQSVQSWLDDYAPSMGAALAYYTMFSIAPLLVIAIAVAGLIFGQDAARGEIQTQLTGLMGEGGAKAVEELLASANRPAAGSLAAVIGVVALFIGATSVFGELQNALDRIWRAPARPQSAGWVAVVRARLLSFGMVLGIGFMLMVSLLLSAAFEILGRWWDPVFGEWHALAAFANAAVSFGFVTVMFGLIYKLIPRAHVAWSDVWTGAAVTSLLFTVGKYFIGLYIGRSGVMSTFGAAGSLAAMLLWVYYSAQIFLLGAEFTWVYAHTSGSRQGQDRPRPAEGERLAQA